MKIREWGWNFSRKRKKDNLLHALKKMYLIRKKMKMKNKNLVKTHFFYTVFIYSSSFVFELFYLRFLTISCDLLLLFKSFFKESVVVVVHQHVRLMVGSGQLQPVPVVVWLPF